MSARTRRFHSSLKLETLDSRILPATHFANGTLTIFGTGGSDWIEVQQTGSQIQVLGQSFDANSVYRIVVDAGDGDDTVTISPSLTAEIWLFGRLGSDRLTGGGGINYLYGGRGDDVLIGGSGRNVLVGGSGNDSFVAHQGDEVTHDQPASQVAPSAIPQQILDLVNQHRQSSGLARLEWSGSLAFGATVHSENMAAMSMIVGPSSAMAHLLYGVHAPTLGSRADLAGYDYRTLGENLAFGLATATAVVDAWMNSPGHRANILNPSFTQIGIAVAYSAQGLPYYTQFFGTPDSSSVPPTSANSTEVMAKEAAPVPSIPAQSTIVTPVPTGAKTNSVGSAPRVVSRRRTAASVAASTEVGSSPAWLSVPPVAVVIAKPNNSPAETMVSSRSPATETSTAFVHAGRMLPQFQLVAPAHPATTHPDTRTGNPTTHSLATAGAQRVFFRTARIATFGRQFGRVIS